MSAEKPQAASGAPAGANATPDPTDGTPVRYWLVVGPFGRIHSGHPTREEAAVEQACIGDGNPYRVVESAPVNVVAGECIRIAEQCAWTNPNSKHLGPELNALAVGEAIAEKFELVRNPEFAGVDVGDDDGDEGVVLPTPPMTRTDRLTAAGVGEASLEFAAAAWRDLADACEAEHPDKAAEFRRCADTADGGAAADVCGVCGGSGRLGAMACNECGTTGRVKVKSGPCGECGGSGTIERGTFDPESPTVDLPCATCGGTGVREV